MPQGYNQSVESPVKHMCRPPEFVAALEIALRNHLPGSEAHHRMAPLDRQFEPRPTDHPRRSAVLALLHSTQDGLALIFTLRQAWLHHHGGQISFPGGGLEPQDKTYKDAALRETTEELGIATGEVQILGMMTPLFIAPSQNLVVPVVGWISMLPPLEPNSAEVAEVLDVPLSHLLDPTTLGEYHWRRNGQEHTTPCFTVGQTCIWGATAMMLNELLEVIRTM